MVRGFGLSSTRSLTFNFPDGKQTAVILQKVVYDVDDVKRSSSVPLFPAVEYLIWLQVTQLRVNLRQWQSPSDPPMNHNFASGRQYEGTAE